MLKISDSQLSVFEEVKKHDFVAEVSSFLIENFDEYKPLKKNYIEDKVEILVERAQLYGFDSRRHIVYYVLATHFLGSDFDRRIPAAAKVLSDNGKSSDWKAAWLKAVCREVAGRRPS